MAFLSEGIRSHGVYDQVCWPVLRILILVVRMLQDGALLAKEHFLTNGWALCRRDQNWHAFALVRSYTLHDFLDRARIFAFRGSCDLLVMDLSQELDVLLFGDIAGPLGHQFETGGGDHVTKIWRLFLNHGCVVTRLFSRYLALEYSSRSLDGYFIDQFSFLSWHWIVLQDLLSGSR